MLDDVVEERLGKGKGTYAFLTLRAWTLTFFSARRLARTVLEARERQHWPRSEIREGKRRTCTRQPGSSAAQSSAS